MVINLVALLQSLVGELSIENFAPLGERLPEGIRGPKLNLFWVGVTFQDVDNVDDVDNVYSDVG